VASRDFIGSYPTPTGGISTMDHDEAKDELIESDHIFRSLYEEHQACETRLDELISRPILTAEEEATAKQIKLHKLHLKDRMEQIIRNHEPAAP
jgi:uncharacterized protein YdcH (DUF465 family)